MNPFIGLWYEVMGYSPYYGGLKRYTIELNDTLIVEKGIYLETNAPLGSYNVIGDDKSYFAQGVAKYENSRLFFNYGGLTEQWIVKDVDLKGYLFLESIDARLIVLKSETYKISREELSMIEKAMNKAGLSYRSLGIDMKCLV